MIKSAYIVNAVAKYLGQAHLPSTVAQHLTLREWYSKVAREWRGAWLTISDAELDVLADETEVNVIAYADGRVLGSVTINALGDIHTFWNNPASLQVVGFAKRLFEITDLLISLANHESPDGEGPDGAQAMRQMWG